MVCSVVVTVTAAFAGGVTLVGLTAQIGGEVVVWVDVTWHVRSTVPLKPPETPVVMLEEDWPPGATASGENGAACSVKSCAEADESNVSNERNTVMAHKTAMVACPARIFSSGFENAGFDNLNFDGSDFDSLNFDHTDFDESDFNMSRFK